MKALRVNIIFLLLIGLVISTSSCLTEEKVVEIVVTNRTCNEFVEDHTAAGFVTPAIIDYAGELGQILSDNDVSRADIISAGIVSGSYGVLEYTGLDDWTISGYVSVERSDITDGPVTLYDYTSQSILEALGAEIPAELNPAGVSLLNRALDDFIAGGNPILVFTVANAEVVPSPSPGNPIQFVWNACLMMQIVTEIEFDMIDP